jgi:hypothetical protein
VELPGVPDFTSFIGMNFSSLFLQAKNPAFAG